MRKHIILNPGTTSLNSQWSFLKLALDWTFSTCIECNTKQYFRGIAALNLNCSWLRERMALLRNTKNKKTFSKKDFGRKNTRQENSVTNWKVERRLWWRDEKHLRCCLWFEIFLLHRFSVLNWKCYKSVTYTLNIGNYQSYQKYIKQFHIHIYIPLARSACKTF